MNQYALAANGNIHGCLVNCIPFNTRSGTGVSPDPSCQSGSTKILVQESIQACRRIQTGNWVLRQQTLFEDRRCFQHNTRRIPAHAFIMISWCLEELEQWYLPLPLLLLSW